MKLIGVRFRAATKAALCDPGKYSVNVGDALLAQTSRGLEYGVCVLGLTEISADKAAEVFAVTRMANTDDKAQLRVLDEKNRRAAIACQTRADELKLGMRIIEADYTFDQSKVVFYFTADGRVDFRELVKILVAEFRTRIELRQIGVRDEAKMLGGLGICGKEFCCSSYLTEFHPVSIKMAKDQNLALNPAKISGTCGRLMCCLTYEQEAYDYLRKNSPRVDSVVQTPQGAGRVVESNLLRETVKVRLDADPDAAPTVFKNADLQFAQTCCGSCKTQSRGKKERVVDPELAALADE